MAGNTEFNVKFWSTRT